MVGFLRIQGNGGKEIFLFAKEIFVCSQSGGDDHPLG